MFNDIISNTSFASTTSSVPDAVFPSITGAGYNNDITFLSTLRALMAPRMPEGDTLNLTFDSANYSGIISHADGGVYFPDNEIRVTDVVNVTGDLEDAFSEMCGRLTSVVDQVGGIRVTKITDFFRKAMKVLCFIHPERKSVRVFVFRLTTAKMHYLQTAILPMLPWYFDPTAGLTADEMALVQSLRQTSKEPYFAAIGELAKLYNFREIAIRGSLSGIEAAYERSRLSTVENNIRSYESDLESYERGIRELLLKRRNAIIERDGLKYRIENGSGDGDSDIVEYFIRNNSLYLKNVTETRITFDVGTQFLYYDAEHAATVIERGSIVNGSRGSNARLSVHQMRALLKAIFVEEKFRLLTCAEYQLDLLGSVNGISNAEFPAELGACLPNAHIDDYSCLGDYRREILSALKDGNIISAVAQCVASAQSLNWGDSTVISSFLHSLYETRKPCVMDVENGNTMTPAEAVKLIIGEEETETKEES